MERSITLRIVLAAAAIAAVGAPVAAQAQAGEDLSAAPLKMRQVPDAVPPVPFSPESETAERVAPVEYRSLDQMTEKDRDLAADAEASISEHAGHLDLEFNQGKWGYRQVVCPAFPNHLFLRFTRNNGTGDVSIFTASDRAAAKAGCASSRYRCAAIRSFRRRPSTRSPSRPSITSGRRSIRTRIRTGWEMASATPRWRVGIRWPRS
jgi:uncharacterized protein with von Willebrand factor type A (vWA) domain